MMSQATITRDEQKEEFPMRDTQTAVPINVSRRLQWTVAEVAAGKKSKRKVLLRDISGEATAGTVTAILGPSGSGKTTLLECISLRNRNFKGAIRLDGQPVTPSFFTTTAMVYQRTLLAGSLTVRELVTFHAISRMSKNFSPKAIRQRVEEVLTEVRLDKCAETIIGSIDPIFSTKGISGGESKRLSLALEMLHSPAIIILDEPTSGLDSIMSDSVMSTVHDLATAGRIIIATLHCPSTVVMEMVDRVILLTHAGTLAFMGPRDGAIKHFTKLGYPHRPSVGVADYLLLVASRPEGAALEGKAEAQRVADLRTRFLQSPYYSRDMELTPDDVHKNVRGVQGLASNPWTLLKINVWRGATDVWRQIGLVYMFWTVSIATNLLLGVLYWQQAALNGRNLVGLMYAAINAVLTTGAFAMVVYIPQDFAVLRREVIAGINSPGPFLVSKLTLILPLSVGPLFGAAILYWMTGMSPDLHVFGTFLGVVALMQAASFVLGVLACAIANDLMTSVSLMPALITPMLIFSGLLYERSATPWYLAWIEKLSMVNFAFSAVVILQAPFVKDGTGPWVLQYLGITAEQLTRDVGMLCLLTAGGFLLAYLSLHLRFRYTNVVL